MLECASSTADTCIVIATNQNAFACLRNGHEVNATSHAKAWSMRLLFGFAVGFECTVLIMRYLK